MAVSLLAIGNMLLFLLLLLLLWRGFLFFYLSTDFPCIKFAGEANKFRPLPCGYCTLPQNSTLTSPEYFLNFIPYTPHYPILIDANGAPSSVSLVPNIIIRIQNFGN